jgi:uncharacterized membrane protein HdeD (DUF308 family)
MKKAKKTDIILLTGIFTIVVGVYVFYSVTEIASSETTKMIAGGFLCILGLILIGLALDRIDLERAIRSLWNGFLEKLGQSRMCPT